MTNNPAQNLEQAQNAWVSFQNQAHIKRPESEYLEFLK